MELYRQGIVAVVVNADGHVLICERSDVANAWQFPQGGIEKGEEARDALYRELEEELGNNKCEIIFQSHEKIKYKWPKDNSEFIGQEQTWFLVKYLNQEQPQLEKSDGSFVSWRWEEPKKVLIQIVDWKRPTFELGLKLLGII